jgi:hypothetical protein
VLSDLIDRESSSRALSVDMPSHAAHSRSRDAVLAMLAADFPREPDHEGLYHEAWAELLALEARGEVVRSRRALLKKIAWRRAADAAKKRRPDTLDPANSALRAAADEDLLPDEQAQLRLDADALRLVVESPSDPLIHSGTQSSVLTGVRSCTDLVGTANATAVIAWNTGQTSTVTYNITTSNVAGQIVNQTTGTVTAGVFEGNTLAGAVVLVGDLTKCSTPGGLTSLSGPYSLTLAPA